MPALRPVVGRKGPPPPATAAYLPAHSPPATSDSMSYSEEESSASEDEMQAQARRSSHKSPSVRRTIKRERSSSRSRSRTRSPAPKKSRRSKKHQKKDGDDAATSVNKHPQQMDRDVKLVASLPFFRFLQSRMTPKACGRCAECKKPACGQCKACIQNAKTDAKRGEAPAAAAGPGVKKDVAPSQGKDRRRCEALKCEKDTVNADVAMPQGVPDNKDALAEELAKVSSDLAELSAKRGQPEFNERQYLMIIERMRALREGLIILKNRKARRRAKFQVGFHDVWGVITSLEKDRLKFAKFIVRTASSEECRTIDMKRMMRDDLEAVQLEIARKHAALLAPYEEKEAFMIELGKIRQ